MSPVEVMVLLIVIFGVIALVLFVVLKQVQKLGERRTDALIADYPKHVWVESVNYFGRQSDGVMQMRGNGSLLLTEDSLVFELWVPQKRLMIPLNSITEITNPRAFLGKSKGQRLLRIDYTGENNQPDAAAWLVRNLETTQTSIEKQRKSVSQF